eukprot:1666790-Pleurochrysis_carterae.AAC.1
MLDDRRVRKRRACARQRRGHTSRRRVYASNAICKRGLLGRGEGIPGIGMYCKKRRRPASMIGGGEVSLSQGNYTATATRLLLGASSSSWFGCGAGLRRFKLWSHLA